MLKIASKDNESLSFTTARLIEIGVMVLNSNNENRDEKNSLDIEEYCQKLIIQINCILKEIAINQFNFNEEKIVKITQDTLNKFNKLKGISLCTN